MAGLNRDQIKLKLIEHLRQFINDETLGLGVIDENGKSRAVPPLESNRVMVDESANFLPEGAALGRPRVTNTLPGPAASEARIAELEGKLDRVLKELEALRNALPTAPARPADPAPAAKPPG